MNNGRFKDRLTSAQAANVAKRWQIARDRSAAEAMARAHASHVLAMARRYAKTELSLDDLVSEGYLGVLLALDKFDPERGVPFGAYALFWIRARLRAYARAQLRLRFIPYEAEAEHDSHWHEPLAPGPNQEQELCAREHEKQLRELIDCALISLDPRERFIAQQRLMVDPQDQPTLAQLAQHLNVSRERVGYLEARTKKKLRRQITADPWAASVLPI